MYRVWAVCACLMVISGCGVAPNQMTIARNDGGVFSGRAGPQWSEAEVLDSLKEGCGDTPLTSFTFERQSDGNAVFTGSCVAK